jgi:outer membrane protein assembly factor BamB
MCKGNSARQRATPYFPLFIALFSALPFLSAQELSPVWHQQIQINPYDLHHLGNQIATIGVDNDGLTALNIYDAYGHKTLEQIVPEVELLGSSLYDAGQQSFYVFGANASATALQVAQVKTDGTSGWEHTLTFEGLRFPYKTVQQGAHIAFTFAMIDSLGHSNGLGWWLVDTNGVAIKENLYPFSASPDYPDLPFAAAYTSDGSLVIGLSNLVSGQCKVLKFNAISGDLLWQKSFEFGAQGTIQCLCTDPAGNIYLSGENGFFVKLSPGGDTVFQKTMGYEDISVAYKMIEHKGSVYIFGGWREDYFTLNAKMVVGRYDEETGDPNWLWASDYGGIENGPNISDALFKNDSTLVFSFSRLFESNWLATYKINGTTGIHTPTVALGMEVYPNPGIDGHCQLLFPANESGSVRIFDLSGKLVREYPIAETVAVDLPCAGAYVAEAQGKAGLYRAVITMQ